MKIKIRDTGEPLVDVREYCPGVVVAIEKRRLQCEKTAYLRRTVAKMLRRAQGYLPKGMRFLIRDAWRPAYVQAGIYFWFIKRATKRYPTWSRARILREVNTYVAPWKGPEASGHMTGGAIDLRLVDSRGRKIPLRSKVLNYQENSLSHQLRLPQHLKRNRAILFSAMQKAGFSNFPKEFWHWSYGDYYWAKRNRKAIALYGPVLDVHNLYSDAYCPCGSRRKFTACHGKVKYG